MVNICKNPLGWLFLDFCLNVRRNRSCLQWVFCCNKSTCCEAVNTKNAKDEIKKSTKGSTKGEVRVRFSNIASILGTETYIMQEVIIWNATALPDRLLSADFET